MSGISDNGTAKAAAFARAAKSMQDRYNPAARERVGDKNANGTGGPNSLFPVTLGTPDPEDDKYKRRAAIIGDNAAGVIPGVGQAIAPEGYFDYAKRKADETMYTNFLEWIFKNADLSTPESAAYWTEKFPFIKEKMYTEIEREADLQQRLAKINAVGPQDEEDWFTLWCIQQGLIKPFDTPIYQLNTANLPYVGGLFSMFNLGPKRVDNVIVPFNNAIAGDRGAAPNDWGIASGYPGNTPTPPTLGQTTTYFGGFRNFARQ